jgi:hypothetical protein
MVKLHHMWYFTSRKETLLEGSSLDAIFIFILLVESSEKVTQAAFRNSMFSEMQCRSSQDMKA